jgi:HAD superfamily phosphatase (TIGR01681 family)
MANDSHPGGVLQRISYANVLFKEGITRRELALLRPSWACREVKLRFHRNHSFEHVVAASAAWAGYAKMSIKCEDAPYDDALSMNVSGDEPDLEVIWYDVEAIEARLGQETPEWLKGRIKALRGASSAPILVVVVGLSMAQELELAEAAKSLPGVRVAPVCGVLGPIAAPFDSRLAKISGARLSEAANLALARNLGCRWLPAILSPRIKAVAVDLDQTIYAGVLGEDGVGVALSPAHASLQESLLRLKEAGLFLAVISKNEPADVEALFAKRTDFPLRADDFSASEIGWGSKSDSISKACEKLRIDPSAVLFIDDNPGELAEVSGRLPGVELLHAGSDLNRTLRELEFYLGRCLPTISFGSPTSAPRCLANEC